MKKILAFFLLGVIYLPLAGQAPAYDDMVFESDSMTSAYKPSGKNFAYLRSKRGAGEMAKTSKADSIKSMPITDIVLVYSEYSKDAIANRENANRDRWEHLLAAYPELFQFETNYKTICQCNPNGDTAVFRKTAGFYVYFKGKEEPKPVAQKAEKAPEPAKGRANDEPKEEKKKEKAKKEEKSAKEEKVAKEEKPSRSKKEEKAEEVAKKKEEPAEEAAPPAPKVKRPGYAKPKKAKDPKACRPPCYVGGDDGLNDFFKENIKLSKKEKRHGDDLVCKLRLQLNFDGTIKKTFITGTNEDFNKKVEEATKNMDTWNSCVVNGTTVKSDVTLTLKYDPATQSIRPFETMITPRPNPKCKCMEDSEMFGE